MSWEGLNTYFNTIRRKYVFEKFQHSFLLFIPSWNIFLKTSGQYKIARFYDKNFLIAVVTKFKFLIHKVSGFQTLSLTSSKETKNLYNIITRNLDSAFGEALILEAFQYLINTNQLIINPKYLLKQKKRLNKKMKNYPWFL